MHPALAVVKLRTRTILAARKILNLAWADLASQTLLVEGKGWEVGFGRDIKHWVKRLMKKAAQNTPDAIERAPELGPLKRLPSDAALRLAKEAFLEGAPGGGAKFTQTADRGKSSVLTGGAESQVG